MDNESVLTSDCYLCSLLYIIDKLESFLLSCVCIEHKTQKSYPLKHDCTMKILYKCLLCERLKLKEREFILALILTPSPLPWLIVPKYSKTINFKRNVDKPPLRPVRPANARRLRRSCRIKITLVRLKHSPRKTVLEHP